MSLMRISFKILHPLFADNSELTNRAHPEVKHIKFVSELAEIKYLNIGPHFCLGEIHSYEKCKQMCTALHSRLLAE